MMIFASESTRLEQAMQCSPALGSTGETKANNNIMTKSVKRSQERRIFCCCCNIRLYQILLSGTVPLFATQLKENASLDRRAQTGSYLFFFANKIKSILKSDQSKALIYFRQISCSLGYVPQLDTVERCSSTF